MHVLLVAHGSADPRHAATMSELRTALRARGVPAEVAYLDHDEPSVAAAVAALPVGLDGPVVAVPMLLTAAFHAAVDVPAAVAAAAMERADLDLRTAAVLGPDPLLIAALERRLDEIANTGTTIRVLVAAGSSDEGARRSTRALARRWLGVDGLHAFATGPGPTVADAVRAASVQGADRAVLAPYLLADGTLADRVREAAATAATDTGIEVVVAPVLGAAPQIVELILRRAREAADAPDRPS